MKFAEEYLKDNDAVQAAIRAGYSESTAKRYAIKMLGLDGIREYMKRRVSMNTEEEILRYLTSVMRGESDGGQPNVRERMRAAELLGKRYGLFDGKGQDGESVARVVFAGEDEIE